MPIQRSQSGNDLIHRHQLANPELQLDLSSDRWFLGDGQASILVGEDVVHKRRFAREGGRKPLGTDAATPIYNAHTSSQYLRPVRRMYIDYSWVNAGGTQLDLPAGYDDFDDGVLGALLIVNDDERWGNRETRLISSYSARTAYWTSGALTSAPLGADDKVELLYSPLTYVDRRGIWITDGNTFWLIQDATLTKFIDLESDVTADSEWDAAQISDRVIMFVSPSAPPRVIRIEDEAELDDFTYAGYAGMLPPGKPDENLSSDEIANYSWYWLSGLDGAMTGDKYYRCCVRAINDIDGTESAFVPVIDSTSKKPSLNLAAPADEIYIVNVLNNSTADQPPIHERWSHLEFWRTLALSEEDEVGTFYLESRMTVRPHLPGNTDISMFNETYNDTNRTYDTFQMLLGADTVRAGEFNRSDSVLVSLGDVATATDLIAGKLPPMCRCVVSLNGTTLCFGSSDPDIGYATLYSRNFRVKPATTTFDHTGGAAERIIIDTSGGAGTQLFENYSFNSGDIFWITGSTEAVTGRYDIAARVSATTIQLASPGPGEDLTNVEGYILRPYQYEWPRVTSDEHVHYSRTDKFAPESFLDRKLLLSSSGDVFRYAVNVQDYVAVIMGEGVHLLYLSGTSLLKDTVAINGEGTPWKKSVVAMGNMVFWATPRGPNMMMVSNSPNVNGHRGQIQLLDTNDFLAQWFQDAYDNSWDIDAGVDTFNKCIRFRRAESTHKFKTLQYSFRNQRWTEIEDDNGIAYASSAYADDDALDVQKLYSIGPQGELFEVNNYETTHPYDSATVEGTVGSGGITASTTQLLGTGLFSADMKGDIVRFYDDSVAAVDGQRRLITAATANAITFATLAGIASTTSFTIGSTPFRVRFAPLHGASPSSVKTLESLKITAVPGTRNTDNANWTDPPTGKFTVRSYRNCDDTALDDNADEVQIYDEDDVTYASEDRESGIECQGNDIEIEIENWHTRSDFRIKSIEAVVREEGVSQEDVSTTE